MAFIDLVIPTSAYGPTWSTPSYSLLDDGYLSTSSDRRSLTVTGFENILPDDCEIDGVIAKVKAHTASGTGELVVNLTSDGGSNLGESKSITGITTTPTVYSVGTSTDLWAITPFPSSYIVGNSSWGVKVAREGTTDVNVDYISLRIYYTSTTTGLRGTRSKFPVSVDTFPSITNGRGLTHQVKSEDVNLLGDALFNLERAAIFGTGGPAIDNNGKTLVVHNMSFEATFGTSVGSSFDCYFHGFPAGGSVYETSDFSLAPSSHTLSSFPNDNIDFTFVKVNAYQVIAGPTIVPLSASGSIVKVRTGNQESYHLGLSFVSLASAPTRVLKVTPGINIHKHLQFPTIGSGTIYAQIQLLGVKNA